MNVNLSDRVSNMEQEQTEITVIRYEPREGTDSLFVRTIRPFVKGFGLLSTFAWGTAALFPSTFRIAAPLQGWVFTIAIVWFFAYCAGFFNL